MRLHSSFRVCLLAAVLLWSCCKSSALGSTTPTSQEQQVLALLSLKEALTMSSKQDSGAGTDREDASDYSLRASAGQRLLSEHWQAGSHPCAPTWPGLQCDAEGNVVEIQLGGLGLPGFLPGGAADASSPVNASLPFLQVL